MKAEIINDDGLNPTVAPYAKDSEAILRITAKAQSKKDAEILIRPVEEEIRNRFMENVYGTGDTSIENVIGELLLKNNLTISTAESCTGGLLAGRIINYSGISASFLEGAVTYSNEAKMKRLGVKKETLDSYGAVSKETAMEMAEGIAKTSGTNIGMSTTGIAGPEGGTKHKPVGLVYLGLYINGKVMWKELKLIGDRQKVRNKAVFDALDWLRRELTISN